MWIEIEKFHESIHSFLFLLLFWNKFNRKHLKTAFSLFIFLVYCSENNIIHIACDLKKDLVYAYRTKVPLSLPATTDRFIFRRMTDRAEDILVKTKDKRIWLNALRMITRTPFILANDWMDSFPSYYSSSQSS